MITVTKSMARRYQTALMKYLEHGVQTSLKAARVLGSEFQTTGADLKELATIHQNTLIEKFLCDCPADRRQRIIRLSGDFYASVITPIEQAERGRTEVFISRGKLIEQLSLRTIELAVLNVECGLEITQRKMIEVALRQNQERSNQLLIQANRLREHSRMLAQRLICAQEDERKRISHELHDVIVQTLMGINIHLITLKKEAFLNTQELGRNITRTQQQVIKSVKIVHQFARRLRPTVLDDLGLVPALQAFMKDITHRTGMRIQLHAYSGIDQLDVERRTTLFRVAQEALTNVARHAHATKAEITITASPDGIRMIVHDDGKSFQVNRVLLKPGHKHLGMIGMRERMEMINGSFKIESAPGSGTTVTADVPLIKPRLNRRNPSTPVHKETKIT